MRIVDGEVCNMRSLLKKSVSAALCLSLISAVPASGPCGALAEVSGVQETSPSERLNPERIEEIPASQGRWPPN